MAVGARTTSSTRAHGQPVVENRDAALAPVVASSGTGTSCSGWTTNAGTATGAVGISGSSRTATAFANYTTPGGITACDNTQHRIMCLQQ